MISIIIVITLIYVVLIGAFCLGFDRVKTFELSDLKSKTRFSIIVPFRNEAKHLPALLESISNLEYPKERFEFIFVDDDSDDDSHNVLDLFVEDIGISGVEIRVINNERITNSPKKDAITLAISRANYDWIVTTDADCVLPKYWLASFDALIQKQHPKFIVAPITYHKVTGFLQNFQLLDVLSLQGATIGGFGIKTPFLCNGANLAYTRQLFHTVNGFAGNSEIASGDDVFLLEKAHQLSASHVHYLKCQHAVVTTQALTSTADLLEQRVRWAAKSSAYKNLFGKFTGIIILIQNALLIISLFLVGIGIIMPKELFYIVIIKFSIDFLLIYKSAVFFDQKDHLKHYVLASLCYPFFSVYVAFLAVFRGYQWKGRNYRQ